LLESLDLFNSLAEFFYLFLDDLLISLVDEIKSLVDLFKLRVLLFFEGEFFKLGVWLLFSGDNFFFALEIS
jgi:hypothetical protein